MAMFLFSFLWSIRFETLKWRAVPVVGQFIDCLGRCACESFRVVIKGPSAQPNFHRLLGPTAELEAKPDWA